MTGIKLPLVSFAVIAGLLGVHATGVASDPQSDFEAPWVGTDLIHFAPTTAEISGGGFVPNQSFWLDLTDPLGNVYTTPIVSDGNGRIAVAVAVDQPGVHRARIRSGGGQTIAEDDVFVGLE